MMEYTFIAKTLAGLEPALEQELHNMGAREVTRLQRGCSFRGDKAMLYKANYVLRTAIRILMPIDHFGAYNERELYDAIRLVPWYKYMQVENTFQVQAVVWSRTFTHTHFVALKVKDAIADQFRDRLGKRPSVSLDNPDLIVNIHIKDNECHLSLDSSGESLHKRGYRADQGEAPLSEVLAAGMIGLTGWDGTTDFYDPMCGSGTLPIEAAMLASQIPAQMYRNGFAFEKWPDYDPTLWKTIKKQANDAIKEPNIQIFASDKSRHAGKITQANAAAARVDHLIQWSESAFEDTERPSEKGIIVTNPPYNERLREKDIIQFYKTIGDTLKRSYAGWDAWIISGNLSAIKHLGLRPSRKIPLLNGSIECSFQKFSMYEGSKKDMRYE